MQVTRILPLSAPRGSKKKQNNTQSRVCFGARNMVYDYVYQKSLVLHSRMAQEVNLPNIKGYFDALKIPVDFSGLSEEASKVVAYCCFYAAEIFRSLKYKLPTKINTISTPPEKNMITNAVCYYGSAPGHPLRSVAFNTYVDWANHIKNSQIERNNSGFSTSYHFLHTTIHEFAHSLHFHHLFSKFGSPEPCPGYVFNPGTANLMRNLNLPLYDAANNPVLNPFISDAARSAMKASSGYGSTLLPETFAEEFTRAVIFSLDPMTLRLKENPFPINSTNKNLNQVLYETWEGLIGDGRGLI